MLNVANRSCIRRLSLRALRANRTRNLVAALAIALTALLFTSLFTIALSISEGMQQSNFRQAGGFAHGSFKYLTKSQFDELKAGPGIRAWGLRRFLGMPTEAPFHKSHVELSYSDANEAHWTYCDPAEGRLPAEGTDEAATDTHVLELLGVEPQLGATFTLTFEVDGRETAQTFTLCGWWEYDEAVAAHHILLPESRVDAILAECGVDPNAPADGMTGSWNLDLMLPSTMHIASDLDAILARHGYQSADPAASNYIATGVNWGYTGAQLAENLDPATAVLLAGVLLLILLTGYLIIYNVFQISVAGDIRFYGLLKAIGVTPRQLRRIIRIQALALSAAGIPLGLVLGWLLGGLLAPAVAQRLNDVETVVSASPLLFVGAALFALVTVLLSCARPGWMAARVSPVEALRYTEGSGKGHTRARRARTVSPFSMARANLGRSRGKTAVTILSLGLAVALLTLSATLSAGFDMDKYVSHFTASDFILADAGKFQVTAGFNEDMAVPEEAIAAIQAQGGVTDSGVVYGNTSPMLEYVTEDWFRANKQRFYTPEQLDNLIRLTDRNEAGLLADSVQLSGMSPFALDHLTVLDGDLSALYEPGSRSIAAVYAEDDYGNPEMDSHWARLGDTVTVRYVEESEFYDPDTDEVWAAYEDIPDGANYVERPVKYRDVDYIVAALVTVPTALSYRYYGSDEFILNDETFVQDSGTNSIMYYAFDTSDEASAAMEAFLADYTENIAPALDYESKGTYTGEFESMRSMFLLLGGTLSFIVGLVGVLNFANAILTGITARRRELAVLQSIGMTARQMRAMLMLEGLFYTLGAAALALGLTLLTAPALSAGLESLFWFFTYRLTLWPIAAVLPFFVLLGTAVPAASCRAAQKRPVVERLRVE